jgi:hypothetical protein
MSTSLKTHIIYAFDMHAGAERISVSLATIELTPDRARG